MATKIVPVPPLSSLESGILAHDGFCTVTAMANEPASISSEHAFPNAWSLTLKQLENLGVKDNFSNIGNVDIVLGNMSDFTKMNGLWNMTFPGYPRPTRATIGRKLPNNQRVAIRVQIFEDSDPLQLLSFHQKPIFSNIFVHGNIFRTCGIISQNLVTKENLFGNFKEQMIQICSNAQQILNLAGKTFYDLSIDLFLDDLGEEETALAAVESFFPRNIPQILKAKLLPGFLCEIQLSGRFRSTI